MIGNLTVLSVITTIVLAGISAVDRKGELDVVGGVELSRYAGRWYEIARLPNRFEKKCADSVTGSNTRELVWRKRNSSELLFDGNAKLAAKSFTSILIPRYRVIKFTLCDPTKND